MRRTVHRSCKMFTRCSAKMFQPQKLCRGRSAKGSRTVRGSLVHPVSFGYTGGVSTEQGEDGPPRVRGRSAGVEKNWSEAVLEGSSVRNYRCGRSSWRSRTVRDCAERGVGLTWLIFGCRYLSPHQTDHTTLHSHLFLSQARGRSSQGGGVLAWFPDGPSTSPDTPWHSSICSLGILSNP